MIKDILNIESNASRVFTTKKQIILIHRVDNEMFHYYCVWESHEKQGVVPCSRA